MRRQSAFTIFNFLYHLLIYLEWVDFQVQISQFDQGVDALCEDDLEVALTRASPSVRGHHPRYGGIGSQEGRVILGMLELVGKDRLEQPSAD